MLNQQELPAGAKPSNNLDRASMKSTTTLKFRVVTKETEGEYICRATNAGGSDERTFKVLVKGKSNKMKFSGRSFQGHFCKTWHSLQETMAL